MSRLSRAECIAKVKEFAKVSATSPPADSAWDAMLQWAIFADDALMQLQRGAAQAAEEHRNIIRMAETDRRQEGAYIVELRSMNHELALRVARLERKFEAIPEAIPVRDSARLPDLLRDLEDLIIRYR